MAFLRRARLWLLGALLTTALSGAVRLVAVANERGVRDPCQECRGSGQVTAMMSACGNGSVTLTTRVPCDLCKGRGFFWTLDDRVLQALPTFIGDVVLISIVTIVGTIIYAFKVVNCRVCDGVGCSLCEGKGWVTAADRWAV